MSAKSPASEHPPRPIFTPDADAPGSPTGLNSPPVSPSSSSGGGGVSGLLRRKSSKIQQQLQGQTTQNQQQQAPARKTSSSHLTRKVSHKSRTSPALQSLALPPSPPPTTTTTTTAEALALPEHELPPALRLSPQLEQPTPPLAPEPAQHALFQPPPQAVAHRPAPYAAVAGPPPLASAGSLGRAGTMNGGGGGPSSRRTSGASSYNDREGGTTPSSGSSISSTAFGSPGAKAKAAPAADLSNPYAPPFLPLSLSRVAAKTLTLPTTPSSARARRWRSQTERPLDTVRRLSRLVDHKDLSYQANRHSSYGAAAVGSIRTDDRYAECVQLSCSCARSDDRRHDRPCCVDGKLTSLGASPPSPKAARARRRRSRRARRPSRPGAACRRR